VLKKMNTIAFETGVLKVGLGLFRDNGHLPAAVQSNAESNRLASS